MRRMFGVAMKRTLVVLCLLTASLAYVGAASSLTVAAAQASDPNGGVTSFGARVLDHHVVITWSTAGPASSAGFIPQRLDADSGRWVNIASSLVPAAYRAQTGAVYAASDPGASASARLTYRLREILMGGGSRVVGPFVVSPKGGVPAGLARRLSEGAQPASAARPMTAETASPSESVVAGVQPTRVRIGVTSPGLYRLTARDIAKALGEPAAAVRSLIGHNRLRMTTGGRMVSTLAAGDNASIYFYGESVDTIYAGTNAYWLSRGAAATMRTVSVSSRRKSVARTFRETLPIEKDVIPAPALFHDPDADFWLWDVLTAGNSAYGDKSYSVRVPDVAAGRALTVSLHGVTSTGATDEHHVRVRINGTVLGAGAWSGATTHNLTFALPRGALRSGSNTIRLEALLDPGVPYSVVGLRAFTVKYDRRCTAKGGQLALTTAKRGPVRVSNIRGATGRVFDLTYPRAPRLVKAVSRGGRGSGAWIQFKAAARRSYVAASLSAARRPTTIVGTAEPGLKAADRGADYVVITAPSLMTSAHELADYRALRGLSTAVVSTQEIYDEFSSGVATPHAITEFVTYALAQWSPAPRFVVLAGHGSYDYRDYLGFHDSLVPPLMVDTPRGLAPSDVRLVEAGDAGVPGVGVGRIPALSADELSAYAAKVQRYEAATGAWRGKMLLAADNADSAGDFPADSNALVPLLPGTLQVDKAYVGPQTFAAVRASLLVALNQGSLLVNYIGHGDVEQLAADSTGAGLIATGDVAGLAHIDTLPVVAMWTCGAGQFALPGYLSLGEALSIDAGGGAIAVFSSTSFEADYESVMLDRAFLQGLFASHAPVLGTVIRDALAAHATGGGAVTTRQTYVLLGDPALVVAW